MLRTAFIFVFALLIAGLMLCSHASIRSKKPIGRQVSLVCLSLIPPILGNMIIIGTTKRSIALVGCYIYYIGMDFIMYALIKFTNQYCHTKENLNRNKNAIPVWINLFVIADIIQMLMNTLFGHAFYLREIEVYGKLYYSMRPLMGQVFHRLVCYGIIIILIITYIIRTIRVPRLYKERYIIILLSLLFGTVWQTYYVASRAPIDRSMIGFAIIGFMIFYFSVYYRPLSLLDRMLADIISDTDEAVILYGPEGRCIWANDPAKDFANTDHDDLESISDYLTQFFGEISGLPEGKETEISKIKAGAEKNYVIARGKFYDLKGGALGSYVRMRDITQEKLRLEKEMFAANHDALTGLFNKEYTFKKISDRLHEHALKDYYIASIYICDLKVFNDVYGREFGDEALIQVANWVRKYADETCIYGRISGDCFCSCLPKRLFIKDIVEKDLSNFKIRFGEFEKNIAIHVGFCEIESDDRDVSVLFDRAQVALDSIRDDYKRHVAFFDKKVRDQMLWNQEISAQLDDAIRENQIVPYLQPIADKSGKIVGAEALVRWIHPVYGFMAPYKFIPLFEENGMITDLDKHIWRSVCRILSEWEEKYPDFFISVNVSPKDFYMTDVLAEIMSYVIEYDVDPKNLRIEVTETSMMRDTEDKMRVLEEFRKQGFLVEMDDFGSGYSSLNMLKNMPVDVLKIDMNFLGKSDDEQRADIIVKNVIMLSEDLKIVSLAEGVETKEQFEGLSELGCRLFQGYYFSKPIPVAQFEDKLKQL